MGLFIGQRNLVIFLGIKYKKVEAERNDAKKSDISVKKTQLWMQRLRKKMVIGDVEKMIAVGLVWGATNALMRRGALLWDQALKSSSDGSHSSSKLISSLLRWLKLLSIWQYTVPFLLNLSASATFFAILSDAPISLAVPVTNATTFAATAVFGMLLGEETRVGYALFGTALIGLGVWLCIK